MAGQEARPQGQCEWETKVRVNTAVSSHYYSLQLVLDTLQNHENLKVVSFTGYKETALFRRGGAGGGGGVS
jgi:hypothetical protein